MRLCVESLSSCGMQEGGESCDPGGKDAFFFVEKGLLMKVIEKFHEGEGEPFFTGETGEVVSE